MSYIDELRKSKDKSQVAYQEFMLSVSEYPHHLFCFWEGKDNPYYVPRIKQYTLDYFPIKCGNKNSVLKVHQCITHNDVYHKYKKAFFIDRDFDPPIPIHTTPIFETPCYSIENLYVSTQVLKEILINEFQLSLHQDEAIINTCLSLFMERQAEFHQATCLFNAWYACLIDNRHLTKEKTGVNLEDKFPANFININLQSVQQNYTLQTLKQVFPHAKEIDTTTLDTKIALFQHCDKRKTFRGKYELQFLTKFIQLLVIDSTTHHNIFPTKIHFSFGDTLSNQQALSVFSIYAETPVELSNYLEKVIN